MRRALPLLVLAMCVMPMTASARRGWKGLDFILSIRSGQATLYVSPSVKPCLSTLEMTANAI